MEGHLRSNTPIDVIRQRKLEVDSERDTLQATIYQLQSEIANSRAKILARIQQQQQQQQHNYNRQEDMTNVDELMKILDETVRCYEEQYFGFTIGRQLCYYSPL